MAETIEPYEVGSQVQLAHTCCGGVPGTVEAYELIRKAREWNPADYDRYRYVVRWSNWPGETFTMTSSEVKAWEAASDGSCCQEIGVDST